MTNHAHEKRECIRYNIDPYPIEVTRPDGIKLHAILNNVSYGGFRILCTDLTAAHILSKKTGHLMENEAREVELAINIPSKESIEKIMADCKITYIAKNEDKVKEMSSAVGLQVNSFKGRSVQILNKIIQGQAIPVT